MKKTFSKAYDPMMESLEKRTLTKWRKNLLSHAKGRVLEIGFGTGVNFPLYTHCDEVIAIEPNPHMIQKAEEKLNQAIVPIQLFESKAESLPFEDESFDSVVVTLVMCSVNNPEKVVQEIKRVLKTGGRALFLEHVKMPQPVLAGLQNVLTPVWKLLCDGCHLNRETEKIIKDGGLNVISRKSYYSGLGLSLVTVK